MQKTGSDPVKQPNLGFYSRRSPCYTEKMQYYPAFLDLTGSRCLIVGAGCVGRRKLASLRACRPSEILVLDTRKPDEELTDLIGSDSVVYLTRPFEEKDLEGRMLVFACSADRELNARIAEECARRGILCNVADDPCACSFIVPAHFRRDGITVALSTGGCSPALSRIVRCELEDWVGHRFAGLTTVMGRLRPLVLALGRRQAENASIFRAVAGSQLPEAVGAGDMNRAKSVLEEILPPELHPHIEELLHGLP